MNYIDLLLEDFIKGQSQCSMPTLSFLNTEIENVIFNDPATIVYWGDGSRTVVKCQEGDTYDKEKGLALCVMKKVYGNKGHFNDIINTWINCDNKRKKCE